MNKIMDDVPNIKADTLPSSAIANSVEQEPDMSEREYRLVAIIIGLTHTNSNDVALDVDAIVDALECYEYTMNEALPMVWETGRELERRLEEWDEHPRNHE